MTTTTNLRTRALAFRMSELSQMRTWSEEDASERRRIVSREVKALEALPADVDDAIVRHTLEVISRQESEAFQARELARAEALSAWYAAGR